MPKRKKTVAKSSSRTVKKEESKSFRWGESYVSLLLGAVVVIIGILFISSIFKISHTKETSSTSTVLPPEKIQENFGNMEQKTYIVQAGDDLWHIAVKFYNNGYNYIDIEKANSIGPSGIIFKGDKLVIPEVKNNEQQILTNTNSNQLPSEQKNISPEAITGSSYTVKKDDTLWEIAVRAYADGYKWTDIAQANNLANPDIIHQGNVFTIPR